MSDLSRPPSVSLYEQITRGIRIRVMPEYLEDQSDPDEPHYVWSYTVRIENESDDIVQLKTRRWHITDAHGYTDEVYGEGVVGEQPILKPGEGFEYTSGAPLATPSGMMVGSYGMATHSGEMFDADIPAFSLDSPYELRQIH